MDDKSIFNATVCLLGIAIFLIHTVDLILKKGKRGDEKNLLVFFVFTAIHFALYLTFVLVKTVYTSDPFVMGFYTTFYILNNLDLFLFFAYAISYIRPKRDVTHLLVVIDCVLLGVFVLLDVANIFGRFFFTSYNGVYTRSAWMILSQGYQFATFAIVFILAIANRKLTPTEKTAFSLYCFLPLVAIVIQNLLPGLAIGYLSIVISIEILFLFANVRKNNALAHQERKNQEAEIKVMMSQIQPHFIYNTLSSISTLIKIDPEKAQHALDDFTEYLRANLSALSDTRLAPISDELRHVETYLQLEQVRFGERIRIVYDIQDSDFLVPPLSVQPLVENAVKHGILQKIEGGTVTVKTHREGGSHIVEIIDDGVGYDPSAVRKGGEHVGLKNVSYRVTSMCNGRMEIQSEIGVGTSVTLIFPTGAKA